MTLNPFEANIHEVSALEFQHAADVAGQPGEPEASATEQATEQEGAADATATHVVAAYGDTPRSLADAHGLAVEQLIALNSGALYTPDSLVVGATYRVA